MIKGILGKKLGMTQIFSEDGRLVPVTVIEAGPCYVLQIKKKNKEGYSAVQLGFLDVKEKSLSKPLQGHFKKAKVTPKKYIKELRTEEDCKVGDKIELAFEEGSFVDITGTSIGKGFQGGVKRWHWKGGKDSHGSMHHRQVGSLSASSFPSRIFKGTHMPGRMGGEKKTVQNLEVVKVDKESSLLLVKGAVPGHANGLVFVKEAKKRKGKVKPKAAPEEAQEAKKGQKPKKKAAKK